MTIGTSQPRELARFYSRMLDLPVTADEGPGPDEPETGGWAQIRPPEHVAALTLSFEYERSYARPVWPSAPGRQNATQHLDIKVDDLPAAVEWAVACGAVPAEFQPQDDVRVMLDPDGHPFCLFL
ncbi:VOC family protein [Nonomuraea sp. NPDC049480]|uniref:VOC family protein n=1 Tax=Nonomuraea sp. NPDC049480 TaxID=3364353 RepID=UPI0037B98328